jgi:drug/metabolite transporter (DMT)-like permease
MKFKGFIYAIISAVFFGSAGIFVKNGFSKDFSPVDLLMLQYIIAGIILFIICFAKYKKSMMLSRKLLIRLFIQGAAGNTLMTVFFYSAFKYLDVSVTTMLLYTYPAMVVGFSSLFLKEKISKEKVIAILGTFTGCVFALNINVYNIGSLPLIGICYGILSAVFYAFMNIYAEKIVDDVPPIVITFYTTIFSLIVLLIFNFSFTAKLSTLTFNSIQNAALLAFFCEIIPLSFLYAAIKYIGPVRTSIITTIEIPSSVLFAFFVLSEKISMIQFFGILLVIGSVVILKK